MPQLIPTDTRLAHLRRFAHLLDDGIRIPGTSLRFGLDPIIGLLPGIGDAAGAVLAAGILVEAVRRGVSRFTLGRIAFNIAVDALVGAVPLIGDAFDVMWKANVWNVALIDRHVAAPGNARSADRMFVVVLIASLVLICAALGVAGVWLTLALFRAMT